MPSSVIQSNTLVMNKYLWMGRQLRNFNDAGSIINWANAMNMVKGLLLKSNDVSSLPAHPAPTSRTPIPSSHSPPQLHRSTDNKNICSPTTSHCTLSIRSITPPTTICFQPKKKSLNPSSSIRCSFLPSKPKPLTTFTLRLPNIPSANSHPNRPKRRKLSIAP